MRFRRLRWRSSVALERMRLRRGMGTAGSFDFAQDRLINCTSLRSALPGMTRLGGDYAARTGSSSSPFSIFSWQSMQ